MRQCKAMKGKKVRLQRGVLLHFAVKWRSLFGWGSTFSFYKKIPVTGTVNENSIRISVLEDGR